MMPTLAPESHYLDLGSSFAWLCLALAFVAYSSRATIFLFPLLLMILERCDVLCIQRKF